MNADQQMIFNIIIGVAGALGGWTLNVVWQSLNDLRNEDHKLADKVSKIEILVAGDYVKKTEFDGMAKAIFAKLDRIEDKLDGKVDK